MCTLLQQNRRWDGTDEDAKLDFSDKPADGGDPATAAAANGGGDIYNANGVSHMDADEDGWSDDDDEEEEELVLNKTSKVGEVGLTSMGAVQTRCTYIGRQGRCALDTSRTLLLWHTSWLCRLYLNGFSCSVAGEPMLPVQLPACSCTWALLL